MIRVGVLGAAGRMGLQVCRAVEDDSDLALVAAIDPEAGGQRIGALIGSPESTVKVSEELDTLLQAEVEVAVDFTTPKQVMGNIRWAIDHAVHIVVGTTGISAEDLGEIEYALEKEGGESNVIVAPNFAIGAVLMQRFAAEAARFFPAVEIIELHHDGKVDAPSGTAVQTARDIRQSHGADLPDPRVEKWTLEGSRGASHGGVRIHSVRLPGLNAHQEILFGSLGQILTLRHDALGREAYVPGVVLAIRQVANAQGLVRGLDTLMGLV